MSHFCVKLLSLRVCEGEMNCSLYFFYFSIYFSFFGWGATCYKIVNIKWTLDCCTSRVVCNVRGVVCAPSLSLTIFHWLPIDTAQPRTTTTLSLSALYSYRYILYIYTLCTLWCRCSARHTGWEFIILLGELAHFLPMPHTNNLSCLPANELFLPPSFHTPFDICNIFAHNAFIVDFYILLLYLQKREFAFSMHVYIIFFNIHKETNLLHNNY